MSDRNTTIVTDSGGNTVVGVLVGIVAVLAVLFHECQTSRVVRILVSIE